jgi:AraC-like DNA-binding protein
LGQVEAIAAFIAQHYREAIAMPQIAAAAELHPKYAMTLFRRHCGMTVGEYLTQQRLSQAQRLLVTTDAKIVDIAYGSGFGSVSRFYAVFERTCGQSPRAYRLSLRG